MINCLIIDDEQPAIDIIAAYIDKVPYFKLLATTTNAAEGLSLVDDNKIDLIFLDIQMPYITGLEFIKAINGKFKIIFTTAYDKYALEGFELDVIDYLLKPVPFVRFLQAAQKAKIIFDNATPKQLFTDELNFIVVQGDAKGKLIKIEINEIDYIEGMGNYVAIHCGEKKVLSLMNMKGLEKNLSDKNFIRVHKSFIVPVSNIAAIDGNVILLKRNNKVQIIVGSAYRASFLEIMKSKMIN
jgi:two-component system LytT family response regulator